MFKLDPLERTTNVHLTIVAKASDSVRGAHRYFTRCVCGKEEIHLKRDLVGAGALQSCGCKGAVYPPRPWTEEDDEFLRREYPIRGWSISGEMKRSAHAVRNRAKLLQLSYACKRKYIGEWTTEDDAIMRKFYPISSVEALRRLPSRTKLQVAHRAHVLGLKVQKGHRIGQWTRTEDRILKRLYPSGGIKAVQEELPRRSRQSILKRAQHFGLHREAAWTAEEELVLRETYPTGGITACRRALPGKSDASINHKVRKFRLVRIMDHWSDEEIAILRSVYPKEGRIGVMKLLPHRTYGTIAYKCRTLGINFEGWWTDEQVELLRTHYPKLGSKGVSEMVGHTVAAVQGKVHALKLAHQRLWAPEEIEILKRVYPTGGSSACLPLLPHHSADSIRSKANSLGIYTEGQGGGKRRRNHPAWSKAA